jgi:hypothetical protein
MQDNLWDAWWGLTPPHVVKWNPPELTTEIGPDTTIGYYANTHIGGLRVIDKIPYTHIIVRSTIMLYLYTSDTEILTYKRPPKPRVVKKLSNSSNPQSEHNSGKPPEILLSFYLKNIYLYDQLNCRRYFHA